MHANGSELVSNPVIYHSQQTSAILATLHILLQIEKQLLPNDGTLCTYIIQIVDTALSPPIPPDLELRILAVNVVGVFEGLRQG